MCKTYKNEDIAQALRETEGMIYEAARIVGCSARTIEKRIESVESLRILHEELRGSFVDELERCFRAQVRKGNWKAIEFGLRTLGRKRGYGDSLEITNANEATEPRKGWTTVKFNDND